MFTLQYLSFSAFSCCLDIAEPNIANTRLHLPPKAKTVLTSPLGTMPSKGQKVSCTCKAFFQLFLGLRNHSCHCLCPQKVVKMLLTQPPLFDFP